MNTNAELTLPKLLPKASLKERIFEWLLLSRIILSPGTRSDLTYNVLAQRHVMGDDTLFINLGYWDKAKTLDEASYEMADALAEKADLQPDDKILDVGFGFGDQDIHWCKTRNLRDLHGVNISSVQVNTARERVQREGLQDRIHLREGNAVATGFDTNSFDTNSFDKVMALECAFHFCTREDFFREAHRVLRPGGRITLADFIAREDQPMTFKRWVASLLGRRAWQIPAYNLYPVARYRQELENLGFKNIRVENINAHVFKHFVAYQRQRFDTEGFKRRYHPLIRFTAKLQIDWGFLDTLDYIMVTAEK